MSHTRDVKVNDVVQIKMGTIENGCIGVVQNVLYMHDGIFYRVEFTNKRGQLQSIGLERQYFKKCRRDDYPELFV